MDEKLAWGLDIDTKGANQAFQAFFGELKAVFAQLNQVGQAAGTTTTRIRQGMGEAAKQAQQLRAEARAIAAEVTGLGRQAEASFKGVVRDVTTLERAIRQVDMSPWQKQADKYAERVKEAQNHVARLYLKLQDTKATDEQRAKIAQTIEKTQAQIAKLQQAQARAGELAAAAAQKQAQAELDRAAAIAKARREREASAQAAEKERQAVAAARAAERSLAAGQRERDRNATGLNRGVDRFESGLQNQISSIATSVRQSGMAEWEKLADNYGAAISRAHGRVRELKASLDGAYLSEKDRLAIQQRIAEAEKHIGQLTAESAKHVEQVRLAEQNRLVSLKANLGEIRQVLQDLGIVAGTLGAGLLAGVGGVVKEFGDFEEQIIKFGAVSDATKDQIAAVESQALSLGASTKFTAKEIAAAQVELSKMGFSAKETVNAMEAMANAAIASGEDLGAVSSTIAATLRMYNMQAAEAGKVSDIITRGANISAQSFASYADSMRYAGAAANGLNQDLTTVATALNMLADRQIKGTQAGEHLKIALNRLATQPKPAAEAIRDLNLAIADTKGTADKSDDTFRNFFDIIKDIKREFADKGYNSIEQTSFLKKLFGAEAVASMRIFIDASEETIDTAIAKQADYAGSTQETAEKMKQGWNYAVEELKGALNSLQISMGKELVPTLQTVAGALKLITDGFNHVPGPIKAIIVHLGLLAGAAMVAFAGTAGISFVVTQSVNALNLLNEVLGGKVVQAMMGAQRASGPLINTLKGVAGTVGGLAAVAGAVYLAFQTNFGGLRDIVDNFLDFLLGENREGLAQWQEEWNTLWANVGQTFQGVWMGATDTLLGFLGFMDETTRAFFSMIDHISKAMRAAADRDWNWFKAEAENAAREAKQILENLFNPNAASEAEQNARRERARKKFFGTKPAAAAPAQATAPPKSGTTTTDGDGGEGGGSDTLKRKMDAELGALETDKARRETSLLNQKAYQAEAKSLDELSSAIGRTALAFASNRDQSVGFQKRMQGIGLTCAATVNEILRLAGVTQDLSKVIGNVNWVPNYDRLIEQGYAERINNLKDLRAGDIVSGWERRGENGHIGMAIGNGQVVHASGTAGRRVGLRQLAAVDTVQGAFGHIRKSHGGEVYGIRFTEKAYKDGIVSTQSAQIKIEEDYHRQRLAILSKYEGAYKQAMSRMAAGSKELTAANGDLLDIQKQIAEEEKALAQLGVDAAGIRKKASEDYLKAVQQDLQTAIDETKQAFSELKSETENQVKSLTSRIASLREANLKATMTPGQQQDLDNAKEIQGFLNLAATYQAKMEQIQADMAELGKRGTLMTPEQRQQLEDLRAEYGRLKVTLGDLKQAVPDLAVEQMTQGILQDLADERDVVDSLKASREAMARFLFEAQKGGEVTDSLQEKVEQWARANGFSTAGVLELVEALKEYTKAAKDAEEAQDKLGGKSGKKAEQSFDNRKPSDILKDMFSKENMGQIADAGVTAFRMIGDAIGEFDRDAGQAFHNLLSAAEGTLGAIGRILNGDILGGAIQGFLNVIATVTGMIGTTGRLIRETREEAERAKALADAAKLDDLDRQIRAARAEGKPTYQLEADRSIKQAEKDISDAISDFNTNLGRQGVTWGPNGLTLNLEGIPLEKQAKVKNDFTELGRTVNQTTGQMVDDIKAAQKAFAESLPGIFGALGTDPQERAQRELDKIHRRLAYQKRNYDEPAERAALKKDFLARLGLDPTNEDFAEVGDQYAEAVRDIQTEIEQEFHGRHINWLQPPEDVQAEFQQRLAKLWPEFHRQIQAALDKASDAAKQQLDKNLQDAEILLRQRAEAMAEARQEMYEEDSAHTNRQIALHERLLAKIEAQNERLRKQIDLKRELLAQDEAKFEREDQGLYAKAVAGVDFDAELRAGLKAIHNPTGVLTETYSGQSHIEAMKERVELLKLSAENKFNLEQFDSSDPTKNKALFLDEMKRITAIEGRFAAEQLKTAEEGSRAYLELQQMQAQAYTSFKEAHLEAMQDATEKEVAYVETQIAANDKKAAKVQQNLEVFRRDLAKLAEDRDRDLKEIDKSVKALTEAHNPWKVAVKDLRDGIKRPLADITSWYRGLVSQLKEARALGVHTTGNLSYTLGVEGKSLNVAQAEAYAQDLVSKMLGGGGLPRMAGGGVVPAGFDGDRFPAMLNSGEPVFPKWFGELIEGAWRMNHGGTSSVYNQQRHNIKIHIHDTGNPQQMKRIVMDALKDADRRGSAVNGAYYGTLN
jgi:TP901 family phage tail tape measure protein